VGGVDGGDALVAEGLPAVPDRSAAFPEGGPEWSAASRQVVYGQIADKGLAGSGNDRQGARRMSRGGKDAGIEMGHTQSDNVWKTYHDAFHSL